MSEIAMDRTDGLSKAPDLAGAKAVGLFDALCDTANDHANTALDKVG